jgi:hypothetical protein
MRPNKEKRRTDMMVSDEQSCEGTACERRLLEILSAEGPQKLDSLCELPEFTWAQVLLSVDHLSRRREISIELVGRNEYVVSLTQGRS